MNPISIPFHLFIPSLVSLILILIIFIYWKKTLQNSRRRAFWISTVFFLATYTFIVGSAMFQDIYCQWDLNKYDLNMNGVFENHEINLEQEAAMNRLISDTGRNFSVFTGLIFSGLLSFFIYVIGKGIEKYYKLRKEESTTHNKSNRCASP